VGVVEQDRTLDPSTEIVDDRLKLVSH
jgi:hypothetical protein